MSKLESIEISQLVTVAGGVIGGGAAARFGAKIGGAMGSGKFDFNRMVDNGNRYGGAGALLGAGGGAAVGGPVGAGIGGAGLGAAGWLGGAAYDANQQANEIAGGRR